MEMEILWLILNAQCLLKTSVPLFPFWPPCVILSMARVLLPSVHCLFNTCPPFTLTTEVPILGFLRSFSLSGLSHVIFMPYFENV